MRRSRRLTALLVAALSLAACGAPARVPSPAASSPAVAGSPTPTGAQRLKACLLADAAGFDDRSLNAGARRGLNRARAELGVDTGEFQSGSVSGYADGIKAVLAARCTLVFTVGAEMALSTVAAAKDHPAARFVLLGAAPAEPTVRNVRAVTFGQAQPAFLAGYLAAAMSAGHKVGTFGGTRDAATVAAMAGFSHGVSYYNTAKQASVQVLGWDAAVPGGGAFLPGGATDAAGAGALAREQIARGADIIYPVAGTAGVGALPVVAEQDGRAAVIWSGDDGFVAKPRYAKYMLTSTRAQPDEAVAQIVAAATRGDFDPSPLVAGLANGAVGLAPLHDFETRVPGEVKRDLARLRDEISAGTVVVATGTPAT